MLGLYLHIPFCPSICNYCNFNRGLFDPVLKRRYVEALTGEVCRAGDGAGIDTIYFGGGTPSMLDPAEVAGLIAACRDAFEVSTDAEVTLETNPETVDAGKLAGFREAGVNRLSFGVQSLIDQELGRLGRLHTAATARNAVAAAREAGFDNVSVDLMMWLPGQTPAAWARSVEGLIEMAPDHASLYLLELYPNAPLREEMARQHWSQAPDEDAADMYLAAMGRLEEAGYEQYEVSNVARPGRRSRHNLKYWTDGDWIGCGCGAHSTRGGVRWRNVAGTADYLERVAQGLDPAAERRELSPAERLGDALVMGLRLVDGVDLPAVERRYGVNVLARYGTALAPLADAGLVICGPDRLRLTRTGMLLANEVMRLFV